ncbi:two-component sensor histidine kinase [Mycobacterium tuberculosis]|nr:two-component sensor histidine kinase [Mycobacterium tuberculosis]
MEYLFILLFIPIAILYHRNSRDEVSRWLIFFMLCAALGSFSRIIRLHIMPELDPQHFGTVLIYVVRFIFYFASHHVFHYALIMYAMVYSLGTYFKYKKMWAYLLLIPLIYSLLTLPHHEYPNDQFDLQLETLYYFTWTTAYDVVAAILILITCLTEKNRSIKKARIQNALILVPTIVAIIIFVNIRNTFHPDSFINQSIIIFVVYSFVIFLVFAVRNGVLGVKIQIKNHVLTSTARVTANSTDIINHTIKDEMNKIRMIIDRAKHQSEHKDKITDDFSKLYSATDQVLGFIDKIRNQTQEVELHKENILITELINVVLEDLSPLIETNDISIELKFEFKGVLSCDPVYTREVLKNLITNSIESTDGKEGQIIIESSNNKRKTLITIKDNGCGIPTELLERVKEPFFSTKKKKSNYGLGLNFCVIVMQKHKGSLEIFSSREEQGTSVVLIFPNR